MWDENWFQQHSKRVAEKVMKRVEGNWLIFISYFFNHFFFSSLSILEPCWDLLHFHLTSLPLNDQSITTAKKLLFCFHSTINKFMLLTSCCWHFLFYQNTNIIYNIMLVYIYKMFCVYFDGERKKKCWWDYALKSHVHFSANQNTICWRKIWIFM